MSPDHERDAARAAFMAWRDAVLAPMRSDEDREAVDNAVEILNDLSIDPESERGVLARALVRLAEEKATAFAAAAPAAFDAVTIVRLRLGEMDGAFDDAVIAGTAAFREDGSLAIETVDGPTIARPGDTLMRIGGAWKLLAR